MRLAVSTSLAAALFVFGASAAGATDFHQRGHHGFGHSGFSYRGKHGSITYGFGNRLHRHSFQERHFRHPGYRRHGWVPDHRLGHGGRNHFRDYRFHYRPHGGYYYRDRFGRLHFQPYH